MTPATQEILDHYRAAGLVERLESVLAQMTPDAAALSVEQLAGLDQFHTRGLAATAELADAADLEQTSRVLDIGCGIGGPARYLAAKFGCRVDGVDLSPGFVEAANYLTAGCGLVERVACRVGDALRLPFEDARFDAAFLQHVAMNIADRDALYGEAHRVLVAGGRLATYDLVLGEGEVVYPVPWARTASSSFLLSEGETRERLGRAGFAATVWRDDTPTALDWFATTSAAAAPPRAFNLGLAMGPDFPTLIANLARNLREKRLGVLFAVLVRG
jgi:SAM-dependent methyltransferase